VTLPGTPVMAMTCSRSAVERDALGGRTLARSRVSAESMTREHDDAAADAFVER
jgi:hypothetical protein